jgi:hypothetical protein
MIHAHRIITVTAEADEFRLSIGGQTIAVVPRTTSGEIHRYKAHATQAPTTCGLA